MLVGFEFEVDVVADECRQRHDTMGIKVDYPDARIVREGERGTQHS